MALNRNKNMITRFLKNINKTKISESLSELDRIINPEIKNDEFYSLIHKIASEENIETVLEIGSSAGEGSTEAFVAGLRRNPNKPKLFCIEISKVRFAQLQQRYTHDCFVKCYNISSVSKESFPSKNEIIEFYNTNRTNLNNYPLDRVLGWLRQDIEYIDTHSISKDGIDMIKQENNIDSFDVVLIDGSEFGGSRELNKTYGAKFIMLDDINSFKNYNNYRLLYNDMNYKLVALNYYLRNGYAIFRKTDMANL